MVAIANEDALRRRHQQLRGLNVEDDIGIGKEMPAQSSQQSIVAHQEDPEAPLFSRLPCKLLSLLTLDLPSYVVGSLAPKPSFATIGQKSRAAIGIAF